MPVHPSRNCGHSFTLKYCNSGREKSIQWKDEAEPGKNQFIAGVNNDIPDLIFVSPGSYQLNEIKNGTTHNPVFLFLVEHTFIMQLIDKLILFVISIQIKN